MTKTDRFASKPLTTEEIKKAHVGTINELNATIILEEYNPLWATRFTELRNLIRQALPQRAVSIEHVGSTSVPGLVAKPIIDISLEVPDSSMESEYVPQLEAAGFMLKIREPEWWEHRMFKTARGDVNLHVFTKGCPEVRKMINFRDHLRSNPSDMKLYEAKKRELAAQRWQYTQNYADAKTEVIKQIFTRIG